MSYADDIDYQALADELGKISAGRGTGRLQEANAQVGADRVGLDAAKLNLQAPALRAGASVQGDILANAQDAQVQGPIVHTGGQMPHITGGLRPSILSANSRQLGSQMSRDALMSQMKGPAFTPTPLPQSGKLDTALNAGAGVAGVLGALGGPSGGSVDLSKLVSDFRQRKDITPEHPNGTDYGGFQGTNPSQYNPADFFGIDPQTGEYHEPVTPTMGIPDYSMFNNGGIGQWASDPGPGGGSGEPPTPGPNSGLPPSGSGFGEPGSFPDDNPYGYPGQYEYDEFGNPLG